MVPVLCKRSHLKYRFKGSLKASSTLGEAGKRGKSNVNQPEAHCCKDNRVIALCSEPQISNLIPAFRRQTHYQ